MGIWIVLAIGWIAGWILFRAVVVPEREGSYRGGEKVSVIIPARNEAGNLPHLLGSLKKQTYAPDEIIVVDDFSEDGAVHFSAGFRLFTAFLGRLAGESDRADVCQSAGDSELSDRKGRQAASFRGWCHTVAASGQRVA